MAYQHFDIDLTKPHGKKAALLVRDARNILDTAAWLKSIADELTGGGANTNSAQYLSTFGLSTSNAGAALYSMLQAIKSPSCTIDPTVFLEFCQGL